MKKVLTILILGLAILAFSGCENKELKQGKSEFLRFAMNKYDGIATAQEILERKYDKKIVDSWVKELEKTKEWANHVKEGKLEFFSKVERTREQEYIPFREFGQLQSVAERVYGKKVADAWVKELEKEDKWIDSKTLEYCRESVYSTSSKKFDRKFSFWTEERVCGYDLVDQWIKEKGK
ncbi:MAG: hypothetical protein LBG67_04505 [Campylobacteraceae bacterium]|jgi:hypothetical protein|nr:hypothetical protein [Campylobacteraceae bacterium]